MKTRIWLYVSKSKISIFLSPKEPKWSDMHERFFRIGETQLILQLHHNQKLLEAVIGAKWPEKHTHVTRVDASTKSKSKLLRRKPKNVG